MVSRAMAAVRSTLEDSSTKSASNSSSSNTAFDASVSAISRRTLSRAEAPAV